MDRSEFLDLMEFPGEWTAWGMLPDEEWIAGAIGSYEPGNEDASEHFRYGAFHHWLRKSPSAEQLVLLARLTWIDPDPAMAEAARSDIARQPQFNADVSDAIRTPFRRNP